MADMLYHRRNSRFKFWGNANHGLSYRKVFNWQNNIWVMIAWSMPYYTQSLKLELNVTLANYISIIG